MLTIPGHCWLCQMPLAIPSWGFCSCCSQQLPRLPVCCPVCGLPAALGNLPCGRCLKKSPPWQYMVMTGDYIVPFNLLIHQFKFRDKTALAPALARLMLLKILDKQRTGRLPHADLILSVPLHTRRQWWRGYNHSDLLAQWLAQKIACPYFPGAITRQRHTHIQHKLNARLRRHNLKNAFRLNRTVTAKHVALVDDIVTTGSTVGEITRLLMRSGAASVQIWCLCRNLSIPGDKRMITRQIP